MFLQLSNLPFTTHSPIGNASGRSVEKSLAFSKLLKLRTILLWWEIIDLQVFMTRNPDLVSFCDNSYAKAKGRLSCTFP